MQTERNNETYAKLREKANQFQNEQKQRIYLRIIDEIADIDFSGYNEKLWQKIYAEISKTTDLDKIAGIYKTSLIVSEIIAENTYEQDEYKMLEDFYSESDIHSFDELWDQMDIDLKTYGTEANLDLLVDLIELSEMSSPIKIDGYGRAKPIFDLAPEFVDWLLDQDWYELCPSLYDEDSFVSEFDLYE